MAKTFRVSFGTTGKPPLAIPSGARLAEALTPENSPIYFGCRDGSCGTCISRVEVLAGKLPARTVEEMDLLDLLCPGEPKTRLACQLSACADIDIVPVKAE